MKLKLTLAIVVILCSCRQVRNDNQLFIVKADVQDTVMQYLSVVSDKEYSKFRTPAEVRYFLDDKLVDSIIQPDFNMISWYSIKNDTTDLVVHISRFETSALLLRFIDKKPFVFHYRAPHSDQNFFKLNRNDSFTSQVEVPSTKYKLSVSAAHVSVPANVYHHIHQLINRNNISLPHPQNKALTPALPVWMVRPVPGLRPS